jgi:hypothetical protein
MHDAAIADFGKALELDPGTSGSPTMPTDAVAAINSAAAAAAAAAGGGGGMVSAQSSPQRRGCGGESPLRASRQQLGVGC